MGKHTFLAREIHTLVLCAAILRREEDIAVYIIVKHVLANQLFVHTHALKNTTHLQAINNLNTISTHLWTVSHLFITPMTLYYYVQQQETSLTSSTQDDRV